MPVNMRVQSGDADTQTQGSLSGRTRQLDGDPTSQTQTVLSSPPEMIWVPLDKNSREKIALVWPSKTWMRCPDSRSHTFWKS